MPFSHEPSKLTETKPFVIEHQKRDLKPSGQFVPTARLLVTPLLRTCGLLAELPDAEAKTLLLLLTFLTPNGHIRPSLPELAQALQTSPDKARRRMERLAVLTFEGRALVQARTAGSGLETYALPPTLLEERDGPQQAEGQQAAPIYRAASREAVIAFSRSHYAIPRAEAERLVALQYGQDPEEAGEGPEAVARRQLLSLGIAREQVAELFQNHALEDIQNQLDWLRYRGAKSPGRFIVAAIQGRYEPPARIRLERAVAEENAGEKDNAGEREPEAAEQAEASHNFAADVFLEVPQNIEAQKARQNEEAADAD